MAVALSGKDTVNLAGRVFSDFADGECTALTYPNDMVEVKTGKNGNSIYGYKESGQQCELIMRMIRASDDDKYLNNFIVQQDANFPATVLLSGQYVKQVGDGDGSVAGDTYLLSGGVVTKRVEAKTDTEGGVDQSIAIYHFKFTRAPRAIT